MIVSGMPWRHARRPAVDSTRTTLQSKQGARPMSTSARPAVLEVSGMTCDDCARHVASALQSVGAEDVSVSWRAGEARFSWPETVSEADLRAAVVGAGYRPEELRSPNAGHAARAGE